MKMKFVKVSILLSSLVLGLASFSGAFALYKHSAEDVSIHIAAKLVTQYYLRVYNSSELVNSVLLVDNPSNDKELMAQNVSMNKGYTAKVQDSLGNWYGSSSSYSHNLTAEVSTNTGYLSKNSDYIAAHDDTYDFYMAFNEKEHTSYKSTYVNVDTTSTINFHRNSDWTNKNQFRCYYWSESNNLISPAWDYSPSMSGKDPDFSCVVPSVTEKVIIRFYNGDDSSFHQTVTVDLAMLGYSLQFDNWNNGTPTVKAYTA